MCRSKNVSLVQEDSDTDSEDTYGISSVSKNKKKKGSRAKAAVSVDRLPFGISSAPKVWQRRMHEFVEGLEGVEVLIADDYLIALFDFWEY
ncbi:Retrovirus-related Pol poly from transposon [Paramuricea clavata]|uniref:Retrovirus-related Pol poly from transposon n=1 Tax=Paramuricea clavata TaxID=317549 RepID=A0A6S7GNN5_PARCT|nr:Retrovirus-related Pol poly from transposon [Paramuricea clavata]